MSAYLPHAADLLAVLISWALVPTLVMAGRVTGVLGEMRFFDVMLPSQYRRAQHGGCNHGRRQKFKAGHYSSPMNRKPATLLLSHRN